METDLENLSKEQLLALLTKAQRTISRQEEENSKLEEKKRRIRAFSQTTSTHEIWSES